MVDADIGIHLLFDKGNNVAGRNPWRAETRGDVGGSKIGRLDVS